MHSHTGGSSQGGPPLRFEMLPQHYQPSMAANLPTTSSIRFPAAMGIRKDGRTYTPQRVEARPWRQSASLQNQQQMHGKTEQEIQWIRQHLARSGQKIYIPTPSQMTPNLFAQHFHNGQHRDLAAQSPPLASTPSPSTFDSKPCHPRTNVSHSGSYIASNERPKSTTTPFFLNSNGYDLSTIGMQTMAHARPAMPPSSVRYQFNSPSIAQAAIPAPLDTRPPNSHGAYSTGITSSHETSQSMKRAPSHLGSLAGYPLSTYIPPQYAGAKRPLPTMQNAYTEGPTPKRGMFPTAMPSRPSSAQGVAVSVEKKISEYSREVKESIKKEAVRRGVIILDMSTQRHHLAKLAGEDEARGNKRRYASTIRGGRKQESIDKRNSETRHRYTNVAEVFAPSTSTAPLEPNLNNFTAQDINHFAVKYGVYMANVELGTHIKYSLQSWLMHRKDIALARSMLEPSQTKLKRLLRQGIPSNQNAASTRDATHAIIPKLRTSFNTASTLDKAGSRSLESSLPESQQQVVVSANETTQKLCTLDVHDRLHAPEEYGLTEEGANLQYQFYIVEVEKRKKVVASLWRGNPGEATWV